MIDCCDFLAACARACRKHVKGGGTIAFLASGCLIKSPPLTTHDDPGYGYGKCSRFPAVRRTRRENATEIEQCQTGRFTFYIRGYMWGPALQSLVLGTAVHLHFAACIAHGVMSGVVACLWSPSPHPMAKGHNVPRVVAVVDLGLVAVTLRVLMASSTRRRRQQHPSRWLPRQLDRLFDGGGERHVHRGPCPSASGRGFLDFLLPLILPYL